MSEIADRIAGLYDRNAARFDAQRGRKLVEKAWLDRFLALGASGARVLDIGCGAGEPIARYTLECGFALTGVDCAPAMIDICRRRFPGADWIVADMRKLSLRRRFGALIAWDSFFHLPRDAQRRMFRVFAEHAEPGAPLMFTCGPAEGEAVGVLFGEPLFHASLGEAEYRALLAAAGFAMLAFAREDPHCGGRTICLAQETRYGAAAG